MRLEPINAPETCFLASRGIIPPLASISQEDGTDKKGSSRAKDTNRLPRFDAEQVAWNGYMENCEPTKGPNR